MFEHHSTLPNMRTAPYLSEALKRDSFVVERITIVQSK